MADIKLKDMINAIDEDIQSAIREHMNRYHLSILEDIIWYAWSDFYYTEHEAQVIKIIQERFSISQEDRDEVELRVLKEISKAAAKSKDYQAGYNVYSRWLEIDPDSKEAKKGLDICKKGLEKKKKGSKKKDEAKAPPAEEADAGKEEEKVEEAKEEVAPEPETEKPEEEKSVEEEKPAPAKPEAAASQPSAPEGPKPEPHPEYPCHTCGKPLYWIPQYQRWYCYTCKKYM